MTTKFRHQRVKDEAQTALFKDPVCSALKTLFICYKNQSVYDVSGTSHSLFLDKYQTHNTVGQSVQLLNVKPVGASCNQ